ncbi:MAG: NAD(P)-binding domain-containing protein [Ancalomicrobiaceae bacterium]|nr:NAD(P)-binding domain-containing protein [Ancalomicrobiaceae bacterium]
MRVGFVGLGIMGRPMVGRLLDACAANGAGSSAPSDG